MNKYAVLIRDCDIEIRKGQAQLAANRLAKVNSARVPREWRLPLAQICRRIGNYSLGIKLLTRLIHPTAAGVKAFPATPQEEAEYGLMLLRSGAATEAKERLEKIDPSVVPEVLLYRSFGHFHRWEYSDALPLLAQYLKAPLEPYPLLVAKTNMAFALLETRQYEVALEMFNEIIQTTSAEGHHQLQSNCHAFKAQIYLLRSELGKAREELEAATKLFSLSHTFDQLGVLKWRLILEGVERRDPAKFDELKTISVKHRDWETVREADLYSLKSVYNRERFLHLYFGTPYLPFRELIAVELGGPPAQPIYVLGQKKAPRMDLSTGVIDGRLRINPGMKCHQILEILLRDFYQPLRVGGLFSALYPGEYFHIATSPIRIRQMIYRTRRWLERERIPVAIDELDGFYSLRITGLFSFRIPRERFSLSPHAVQLERLRKAYPAGRDLVTKDIQRDLGVTRWTAYQIIKHGLESGILHRLGTTDRDTKYRIEALAEINEIKKSG